MNKINGFVFEPKHLAIQRTAICEKNLWLFRDEEADQILTEMESVQYAGRIPDEATAGLVVWSANQSSQIMHQRILKFWKARHSLGALKLIYTQWQETYDSEIFARLCAELLAVAGFEAEWVKQWKRWLTASDVPMIAAGSASAFCRERQITFHKWAEIFKISVSSRLGEILYMLFFCFCSEEEFNCTDEKLAAYICRMNNVQRERLFRNMLCRFSLMDENEECRHLYIQKYNKSLKLLCSLIPESAYCKELYQMIAHEMSDFYV